MNIVIKGADFSAVSIGKYASTEIRELLSVYSSITESQIMAINTFLLSIGYGEDNSVWAKMKHLFLPCVSANLHEALYDVVNRTEPTFDSGARDYVVFDDSQKSVTSVGKASFLSNYDAIKICPFAVSKTGKAANGIDSVGNGFMGVNALGAYFGNSSKLLYAEIRPRNILVLVAAGIDADSLNAANIRLVSETGVTTPFSSSSNVYSSKALTTLLYANAKTYGTAEDIILGWAEGLSLDEGVLLETALNKLQQDLL